jgi:hypothetical protein
MARIPHTAAAGRRQLRQQAVDAAPPAPAPPARRPPQGLAPGQTKQQRGGNKR